MSALSFYQCTWIEIFSEMGSLEVSLTNASLSFSILTFRTYAYDSVSVPVCPRRFS